MLRTLTIENFVTIEKSCIDFSSGLTVITGDTGAGKSVLLNALNVCLGAKANTNMITADCAKAQLCAVFYIGNHPKATQYLTQYDLLDGDECFIRKTITYDGRSRSSINNIPVPLSQVKGLSRLLIEIYGQHSHQTLLEPNTQQALLDGYANHGELLGQIGVIVAQYQKNQQAIHQLTQDTQHNNSQIELLKYQLQELEDAQFNLAEVETLEAAHKTSTHAQSLFVDMQSIEQKIQGTHEQIGVQDTLNTINQSLSNAAQLDASLSPLSEQINSIYIQLQEAKLDIDQYLNSVNTDEQNIQQLSLRLSELNALARKHNIQIPDLVNTKEKISNALITLNNGHNNLAQLEILSQELLEQYKKVATKLSKSRIEFAPKFAKKIIAIMKTLGMPHCQLMINLSAKSHTMTTTGQEQVGFKIAVNLGQNPQPLKQSISGGELSRLNLAIAMVSNQLSSVPSLVFDEVDTGISGGIAQIVGQSLRKIASHYQILCITHLAQVGAQGHQHLLIKKHQKHNTTSSEVITLNPAQRIDELARILDGVKITDSAKNVAKNLLENK